MSLSSFFTKDLERSVACIFSLKGLVLTDAERALFRSVKPFGFILFGRNIHSPNQVEALCRDLRETVGRHCPILIDQEGGRVQRLKLPHWPAYKPMKYYGDLYRVDPEQALDELRYDVDCIAFDLSDVGVSVNCAPVMDVLSEATHDVIGDRAFSDDPNIVAKLSLFVCERYIENGITPIFKHIPGHGRAAADSHLELPVVDTPLAVLEKTDFYPFKIAAHYDKAQVLWAMSAHVIYSAIDPKRPATLSPDVVSRIIRGSIGFDGILVGDDLDMKALEGYGTIAERAVQTIEAGCDLALYCWADLDVMEQIAAVCPKIGEKTLKRLQKADALWDVAA